MGEYSYSMRMFGPKQVPFRYGNGLGYRPDWLRALVEDPPEGFDGPLDRYEIMGAWLMLVAYVANTANYDGAFDPAAPAWLEFSELNESRSLEAAEMYVEAGGLEERDGKLFVRRWAEEYRNTKVSDQLSQAE